MFLWQYKSANIVTLETMMTIRRRRIYCWNGGDAAREPYMNTPLDFVSRKKWSSSIYWSHLRHALARCMSDLGLKVALPTVFLIFLHLKFPSGSFALVQWCS